MSNNELVRIEDDIQQAKGAIELGKAMDRLRTNRDFKKIVLDGYFRDEAVRLVHAKSESALQDPAIQARIISDIDAVGCFLQYITGIARDAEKAVIALAYAEEIRDEIVEEEEA